MSGAPPAVLAPGRLPEERQVGGRRRRALAAGLVAAGLAGLLLWALSVGDGGSPDAATGLPTAGPLAERGLPLATLAARVAAVGTVGTLLLAAVLLPGRGGDLPAASRRALRACAAWALAWAGASVAGGFLSLSVLTGTLPQDLPWASVRVFVEDTGAGRAALLVAVLAAVLAVTAPRAGATGVRFLLAAAVVAVLVPVVLTGHSSAAEDHLLAVTALGVHVVAATVWVGGLLAVLVHGRRDAEVAAATQRYSRLALACFLATAGSGVLAAWVVLGSASAVLGSLGAGYGTLLAAKISALVLLGLAGWQHRRRTLPRLRAGYDGAFRRFAGGEVLLMLATLALAVALAASPPPAGAAPTGLAAAPASAVPGADPMAGHDHGELSVGVLVDDTRFHVAGPVAAGARVTVHNATGSVVTLTAADGSFDVVLPPRTLSTFLAPQQPGAYPFTSAHSPSFADVLVVE